MAKSTQPLFNQVSIVGLGLIGGSLGMALRKGRVARRVIGFSRHEATIRRAKDRGAVDDACTELCPDWLGESDLVVIATPPLTVVPIARRLVQLTLHRFILTDVASTKGEIVQALGSFLPERITYVGSHPMAGSERSGIGTANPDLFRGAPCVVTPVARTSRTAVRRISALWRSVGGRCIEISPAHHDTLVAQISHLPHLTAVGLTLAAQKEAMGLSAGGFSDTTRVALGDPALWREICWTNRRAITSAMDRLLKELHKLRGLIASGNSDTLTKQFCTAQKKRQRLKR